MRATGRTFVALAILSAVVVALVADWMLHRYYEVDGSTVKSVGTAVVVGGFLALVLLRPRKPKAKGFIVDDVHERRDVDEK